MNTSKPIKGKPITTSVPSIAIRFHAGGEELEELYPSEDDEKSEKSEKSERSEKVIIEEKAESGAGESNKHESSPMRDYLNKFGKRSSSIDTGINESTTTATSDPWRLFSEFKGKLTKTVEEKLSEIKSKSNENEGSPKHGHKGDKGNKTGGSKENSSVSDSEEQSFSECSVAKSSGLNSTAEDIEMSSDDENSLAESDKTPTESVPKEMASDTSPTKTRKHFFRHKNKEPKSSFVKYSAGKDSDGESQVKITSLTTVPEKDDNTPEDEVESGVEAYEEFSTCRPETLPHMKPDSETLVAPTGFFDTREKLANAEDHKFQSPLFWTVFFLTITLCIILPIPHFLFGFILGAVLTALSCYLYYIFKLKLSEDASKVTYTECSIPKLPILEIQAVKEYQPVTKFEGWINEYPEEYEPHNYHIMQTQTVFLKLEGNILRVYNTRAKIPKRAMWNEPKHDVVFSHVRIYNLKSSKIKLLPAGLIPKRLWSKKYPICILLNKEKMNEDLSIDLKNDSSLNSSKMNNSASTKNNEAYTDPLVSYSYMSNLVLDSQIDEEDMKEMVTDENDFFSDPIALEDDSEVEKSDTPVISDDWDTLNLDDTSNTETKLYFFARTCRDKEEWYRRFVIASRDPSSELDKSEENLSPTPNSVESVELSSSTPTPPANNEDGKVEGSTNSHEATASATATGTPRKSSFVNSEEDFMRYMARFQQVHKTCKVAHAQVPKRKVLRFRKTKHNTEEVEEEKDDVDASTDKNNVWLNFFIARVFYDVCQHEKVINSFLTLIQRKLSTIKLPYFIEDIVMTDLSLGKGTPQINHIYEPRIDEKGLWIFMDIVYEGVTSMAIETKLNLMKLKELAGKQDGHASREPSLLARPEDRSPIYHSDVEDSAESSDDEASSSWAFASTPATSETNPNSTPRKPSATGGRKFLLMVDKIASSKYFQQATEIKYIKRAMEGVSNTEIKLSVEIQYLSGTLAVNIPSPPSDRVWVGFRGNPDLHLSAHPAFGERSINFMHVTKWIEKKLAVEFQKFFVLPNMEDFVLPILIPKLPE